MATLPTVPKAKKLLFFKYAFSITVLLAVLGIIIGFSYYSQAKMEDILVKNGVNDFTELGKNLQEAYRGFEKYVWHTKIKTEVIVPIAVVAGVGFMIAKDEIKKYFNLPKGVGFAIFILILSFILQYFIMYVQIGAGSYLFITLINALYFDPLIEKYQKEGTENA